MRSKRGLVLSALTIAVTVGLVVYHVRCQAIETDTQPFGSGYSTTSPAPSTQANVPDTSPVLRFGFDGPIGKDGLPVPWAAEVIHGNMNVAFPNRDGWGKDKVIHLKSDSAHYLIYDKIEPYDPQQFPVMTWSWKAVTLPTNGDVRTHAATPIVGDNRNDKAVQVVVGFDGKYAINYSWDTTAPVGTAVTEWSPVTQIKTIIVESGRAHLNQWMNVRVNLYQDFQHLYRTKPGKVVAVSVQTNSNHTGTHSDGYIGAIFARQH
jgi:hypothetical protein